MSKGLVLVSGVTGFVGTAVARAFVDDGYSVRGTSRTQHKIDEWAKFNPAYADKIEWVIVKDGSAPNAFDKPVQGVDYIAHTASPFHMNIKDNEKDMLIPAVEGTKNMLSAAKKEPKVKHVVITSSFAAIVNLSAGAAVGKTYTPADWNPATWDEAKTSDGPSFVYCASKAFAEKVAWDDEERTFPITAICPPMIFGPPSQPISSMANLNTSIAGIYALISAPTVSKIGFTNVPAGTDVRDVAALHVKALTRPPTNPQKAQRFLAAAWHFHNHELADIIASSAALASVDGSLKSRIPADRSEDPTYEHFGTDSSAAEELLGRSFIGKEQCIVDTVTRLLELEKTLPQK